jgi:exopolysaccharide biosynthesis polyprenyl glycosylphosphotransferase
MATTGMFARRAPMGDSPLLREGARRDRVLSLVDDQAFSMLARRARVTRRRGWLVRRLLLVADLVGLIFAYLAAALLFEESGATHGALALPEEALIFAASLPGWIVFARAYGLYSRDDERADHSTADDAPGVFHMVTVGAWFFYAFAAVAGVGSPDLRKLLAFWALAIGMSLGARALARSISRRTITYIQNTVIVGAGDVGQGVARKLLQHPEYGVNLVGFLDSDPKERPDDLAHVAILGSPDELPSFIRLLDIERVVVAFTGQDDRRTLELIRALKDFDVQVDVVPRLFDIVGPGADVNSVAGIPLLSLPPVRLSRFSRLLKRSVDVFLAIAGLLALAPLFAAIALAIWLDSRGSIFFRQTRVGMGNRSFRIWKFRTMVADADGRKSDLAHLNKHAGPGRDARMFKVPNDPRVTRVGRFLRRYSLDELPQLLNALRGQMSLVGPRPLVLEEDRHVEAWARRRVDLKPGITGPWQVLGRSDIPFEEMVKLDYLYVTTWSLWNDLRLLARTVPCVARGRGY